MRPHKRRKPLSEINVVPYIDVMLVLLIIFMITTPLLSQGVKVDLPKAHAQALDHAKQEPIVVSVDATGRYYLNIAEHPSQPIEAEALSREVSDALQMAQRAGSERAVFVNGDAHVDYAKVVQAMVLLQHAGAPHIGLMTQEPPDRA